MADRRDQTFVAAIDAGNTKTVAAVADGWGRVRGYARGGSGNIYHGLTPTMARLDRVYREALATAGLVPSDVKYLTISATGADWPEDFSAIEALATEQQMVLDKTCLGVINDAVGSLWAGSPSGEGVVAAVGTSAGTAARLGERVWHSSYWQQVEGAVELGQKGLRAVFLAELGLLAPTRLTEAFLEVLELPDAEALLHAFTARNPALAAEDAGRLARVLLDVAEAGDEAARRLATAHGAALGAFVNVAARKVGLTGSFSLVMTGGLMRHPGSTLKDALLKRVCRQTPEVVVQPLTFEPVGGALCAALTEAACYTPEARSELRNTLPHSTYFAT